MAFDINRYKRYDTSKGYGNEREWQQSFYKKMTGKEAAAIIEKQERSPWDILGVGSKASKAEIKAAFRKLLMEWHPDRNPDRVAEAEEMTKKIIAAYTILTQ